MPDSPEDGLPHVPAGAVLVEQAGERVVLLGQRALYWPARRRLVIADLHLGKSHVFRQAGIAVPRGATADDVARLSALIDVTGAQALWVVGDLLHGPLSAVAWHDTWMAWRQAHAGLDVAVVTGNHDRALTAEGLGVRVLGDACEDGPFLFRHHPQRDAGGRYVIAGHLHPAVRLPGLPRRWPAFWLRDGLLVLPAYSAFTGSYLVQPGREDRLVACADGVAVPLASNGGAGRRRQPRVR